MNKDALIEDFRDFVTTLEASDFPDDNTGTDLYAVQTALTTLQGEVKSEARMFKGALDDFRSVFETLKAHQEHLTSELHTTRTAVTTQKQAAIKTMLLEWLEFRDRIVAALEFIESAAPQGWRAHFFKSRHTSFNAILEGQRLALRSLDDRLYQYVVQPLVAKGESFNPETMRAVGVVSDSTLANAVVAFETRTGFQWEGRLLRPAEVTVNKLEI